MHETISYLPKWQCSGRLVAIDQSDMRGDSEIVLAGVWNLGDSILKNQGLDEPF